MMKVALALGVAFAAMAMAAEAQPDGGNHVYIRTAGPHVRIDADNDGWITRAEAASAADRAFGDLDSNHDGRLTSDDRPQMEEFNIRTPAPGEADEEGCNRTVEGSGDDRRVTIICRSEAGEHGGRRVVRPAPGAGEDGERHVEHSVTIIRRGGGDEDVAAPVAPIPPVPPMAIMLFANSEEADLNGDGALSQDEFRAQHLRFFDASDVNGDGRVKFDPPPRPPQPPEPPAPPAPPRH
jgi:hypothetical protein